MFKSAADLLRHLDLAGWLERRDLEFKSGLAWDALKPKLVRGALALSNTEGGGYLIVGIGKDKGDMAHKPEGMPKEVALTYDPDRVPDHINSFADPPIDIEVRSFEDGGRFFIAIKVHEFATEPVICKKGGGEVRRGSFYYRSRRMPQSSPVTSSDEMREIIDRAVDKALRKQRKRLRSYPPQEGDMFADEQREASPPEAEAIMKVVRERGHWEIRIRPAAHPGTPHRPSKLKDALLKSQVQYRGLPYPHGPQSRHGKLYTLNGCIESRVRWAEFAGVLRLYASGQFVHRMAMPEDMLDDVRYTLAEWDTSRAPRRPPERTFMYPVSATYYLTEIYAFASSISREGILGDDDIVIEITLRGQGGRALRSESTPFMFAGTDVCDAPEIKLGPHRIAAERLRTDHDDMAVHDAATLLEKYGVDDDAIEGTLRGWQADLYQRRS